MPNPKSQPEMMPLPDYGEHMPLTEFVEQCQSGTFIDYDGWGNYATETEMTDLIIKPSDVIRKRYRKDYTHVIWFNR